MAGSPSGKAVFEDGHLHGQVRDFPFDGRWLGYERIGTTEAGHALFKLVTEDTWLTQEEREAAGLSDIPEDIKLRRFTPEEARALDGCPFCNYSGPSRIVREWPDGTFAITPLNPVVPGHLLVIPKHHFRRASEDWAGAGEVFAHAAELSSDFECNIIQSNGRAATQSVEHFHIHIVPRTEDDGIALPWDSLEAEVDRLEKLHFADCGPCNVLPTVERFWQAVSDVLHFRNTETRGAAERRLKAEGKL
jgi:histidine triad (HIT) family protein